MKKIWLFGPGLLIITSLVVFALYFKKEKHPTLRGETTVVAPKDLDSIRGQKRTQIFQEVVVDVEEKIQHPLLPADVTTILGGAWEEVKLASHNPDRFTYLNQTPGGFVQIEWGDAASFEKLYAFKKEKKRFKEVANLGDQAFFTWRLEPGFGERADLRPVFLHIRKRDRTAIISCQKPSSRREDESIVCDEKEYLQLARKIASRLASD